MTNPGGILPATSGEDVGSIFFDAAGTLYAATNQGTLVLYNTSNGTVNSIGTASSASQSDGASCVFPTNEIDVVLSAARPSRVNATTFDIPFTVKVKNTGAVADPNVQLNDFLDQAFPTATTITVSGLTVSTTGNGATPVPTASGSFTGLGLNTGLLDGSSTLAANATTTITYTVRVRFPAGSVPATAQLDQVYASTVSTGPNNGYTLVNGAMVPPSQLLAADLSTNTATLPATPNGDTPSMTPVLFDQPTAVDNAFNTPNNTNLTAAAATSVVGNDAAISPNTIAAGTVDLIPSTLGAIDQTNVPALTGSGTFSVNASGQISYSPGSSAFTGVATIQYTVRDNTGGISNPATISVNVGPLTANDAISTAYNAAGATVASITGNDTDVNGFDLTTIDLNPATPAIDTSFPFVAGGITRGTFTVNPATGIVTYTPAAGSTYTAPATATYTVRDNLTGNQALSSTGTITVTLTNAAPVVANITNVAMPNTTTPAVVLNPNLSASDANGNGTIVSYTVNPVSSGTLYYNGTAVTTATSVPAGSLGLLTYLPNSAFFGNATFSFTATDQAGATSTAATYTIPVQALPTATPNTLAATNPGGTQTYPVPATGFAGADPDGTISSLTITALPATLTSITLNGSTYTAAGGGGTTAFPAGGVVVATNSSGNPTTAILVDPVNNTPGATLVVLIPFKVTDNNGNVSTSPANLTLNFADLTITGTVYLDPQGGTIGGGGATASGTASTVQLYANLVSGGAVIGSVAVAAGGTYSLGTAANVQLGSTYSVVLSTSQTSLTSVLPTPATGSYASTAEGTTAAGDGTPDGLVPGITAAQAGVNFAIEQRPLTTATTTRVVNTGPTAFTVPATGFTGSDADGTITNVTITAFPTVTVGTGSVTSITINGTTYTVAGGGGTTAFPAAA